MLALDLPPFLLAWLSTRRADRGGPRADRGTTAALLADHGAHAPALDFEAMYGGLRIFNSYYRDVPLLLVGPYACLSAIGPDRHHDGLVPAICNADDSIYSLDTDGRGSMCNRMVQGMWRPCARDGRQLLTQAILWCVLDAHPAGYDVREGRNGASIATEFGLAPIDDATCDDEQWWGDATRLVVEIPWGNGFLGPVTYASVFSILR